MGFFEKLVGTQPKVDFKQLLAEGAVVVDVRTPFEFQSGHARASKNIPLQNLNSEISKLKGKKVILVCRSGARAGQAQSMLSRNGIEAYNAGAWQNL